MGNRETRRSKTSEYTTHEGVTVTEENYWIPMRKETDAKPLKAEDICEFDFITFEKAGSTPVHWVRESANNQCSDHKLQRYAWGTAYAEMKAYQLTAEELTVFIERKNRSINQIPFFTPAMGEGDCKNDPEEAASIKAIDQACKENFMCKDDLASKFLQHKNLDKADLYEATQPQAQREKDRLWHKLEMLSEGEQEQKQEQEQEQKKRR